jgi:hypothetical protein
MPAQNAKTILLVKEKETKNTVKFTETQVQGQAPVIGTLYLQRWFVGAGTNVKVTVEVAN